MSIIFVFLVKDCEKQVSNCIFDTCFSFSQRRFSSCIARFSLWRRNGLHKPQNAFGVKAVRKAHFAVVGAHFQPVTICNSFISLCAKYARLNCEYRQNADSKNAVGILSVRYSPTYKKFDRTEWCRFAPFGLRGGDPVYLIVHGQTPRRSERGEGVPLCAVK